MAVKIIGPEVAQSIANARREKQYTQLELSEKARVSVRTIQDLEHGRRDSFSESTLIQICRALEIDIKSVLGEEAYLAHEKRKSRTRIWLIVVLAVLGAVGVYLILTLSKVDHAGRLFTMPGKKLEIVEQTPDWGDREGIVVNYVKGKTRALCGEVVRAEIKWSYRFGEANYFAYYACTFTEWDPQNRIRINDGIMFKEGSQVRYFEFRCPEKAGKYRIRIFFASPNAPIASFYGHDINNRPTDTNLAQYLETTIQVVSK